MWVPAVKSGVLESWTWSVVKPWFPGWEEKRKPPSVCRNLTDVLLFLIRPQEWSNALRYLKTLIFTCACKPNIIPIFWVGKYALTFSWDTCLPQLPNVWFFGMLFFISYGAEWPKILNKYLICENCSDICVCCLTTCACFAIFSLLFTLGLCFPAVWNSGVTSSGQSVQLCLAQC